MNGLKDTDLKMLGGDGLGDSVMVGQSITDYFIPISIPTIFISGQVTSNILIKDTGLRQFGIQESDIVTLVKSITKYSVMIDEPNDIFYHLEKLENMF